MGGQAGTQATLRRGLRALGPEVVKGLRFVCSDMWKPYLRVIAAQAGHALHVLDRFHITSHLNQAVDEVRRAESRRLRANGKQAAERLKHMRWPLLRRGSRVRGRARQKLNALLASKIATARAWELKETFRHFWNYKSITWARRLPRLLVLPGMRSRLEPMMKVARMLRAHEELILNWFRAKGEISSGAVEGLNNKRSRRSKPGRTPFSIRLRLQSELRSNADLSVKRLSRRNLSTAVRRSAPLPYRCPASGAGEALMARRSARSGARDQDAKPEFARDICNMPKPLFSALPAMVGKLPILRRGANASDGSYELTLDFRVT